MANLFWRDKKHHIHTLTEDAFDREEEIEQLVADTPALLLGDIFVLSRQVRARGGADIPDMIGVDRDNNIVVIEIKNKEVSEDIVPQLLRYAIWAEGNPDSIKAMWLECMDRPDDIQINWDDISIRLVVIAPVIRPGALRAINKINYVADLLSIKRFRVDTHEFVLVERVEPEPAKRATTTVGMPVYDRSFYLKNYNQESANQFLSLADAIEQLVSEQGWALERKFNKGYVAFKHGFFNAFGVTWTGSKSLAFLFKVSREQADSVKIPGSKLLRYEDAWKQVLYKVDSANLDAKRFLPLFRAAYENIAGKKM